MSAPKLIFSFATGVEFAINRDELPDLSVIKFGQGFDDVEAKFGDVSIEMVKPEMSKSVKPIIEFNLKSVEELPMPKKGWIEKNSDVTRSVGTKAISAPTVGFNTAVPVVPLIKGKDILHEEESVDACVLPSSEFKIGSDSKSVQQIKAQERKHNQGILKVKHLQQSEEQLRPYQISGRQRPTMNQRLNKVYPFKEESVSQIFHYLIKRPEFRLPEPKKPDEINKKEHPEYCPYHRLLGHTIKDCFCFKDWLEKNFRSGNVIIPNEYLKEPEKDSINMISSDSISFYTTTQVLKEISDVSWKSSIDLKVMKGKSIESALEKLRADIAQLFKDQKQDIEDEDYSLTGYMGGELAEINVVETRATLAASDAPPLREENAADEWQRAIQTRDEQILRLEKRMEEMTAAMTAKATVHEQAQSRPTASPEVNQPEIIHITEEKREVASASGGEQPEKDSAPVPPEKDVDQRIEQKVWEVLAQSKGGASIAKGRP